MLAKNVLQGAIRMWVEKISVVFEATLITICFINDHLWMDGYRLHRRRRLPGHHRYRRLERCS